MTEAERLKRERDDRTCEEVLELLRGVLRIVELQEQDSAVDPTSPTTDSVWLDNYTEKKKDPWEAAREAAGRSMYIYDDD